MKIWEKGIETHKKILEFTIGNDRELDLKIAEADIVASIAHVKMLLKTGLITKEDEEGISGVLLECYEELQQGSLVIGEGIEDIHSLLEYKLTEKLGESGKKVHTARSRNDQVLTALKLYYRDELVQIAQLVSRLAETLLIRAEENSDVLMPGYTHMQAAMKSSFGLWFSAWAEAFTEDIRFLKAIKEYLNSNPLGSAAGYGSSFPIDREMTTHLLEFDQMHVNSVNAQLSRGKTERMLLSGLGLIAGDISKMSGDMILFLNQNFDFIELSEELTTGSSIMPHKKNPDVIELTRARANLLQSKEVEAILLLNNLPSGYHRDFQLLKEICFPALENIKQILDITIFIIQQIKIKTNILDKDIYRYLSSVDAINLKVSAGLSFRDAYREIAEEIRQGKFQPVEEVKYTHTGSIGNPGIHKIREKLQIIKEEIGLDMYLDFFGNFVTKVRNKEL